jgi:hypothetical protein
VGTFTGAGSVTEPKDAPADSFGGFVVETEVKPDGRLIHYYEWPVPAASDDAAAAPDPESQDDV